MIYFQNVFTSIFFILSESNNLAFQILHFIPFIPVSHRRAILGHDSGTVKSSHGLHMKFFYYWFDFHCGSPYSSTSFLNSSLSTRVDWKLQKFINYMWVNLKSWVWSVWSKGIYSFCCWMSVRTATNSIKIFNEWAIFAQNSCSRLSSTQPPSFAKTPQTIAFWAICRAGQEERAVGRTGETHT